MQTIFSGRDTSGPYCSPSSLRNDFFTAAVKSAAVKKSFLKEEGLQYGPLVSRPEKIVCIGLNYRKHAKETNQPVPKAPILFNKFNNSLSEHNGKIKLPGPDAAT